MYHTRKNMDILYIALTIMLLDVPILLCITPYTLICQPVNLPSRVDRYTNKQASGFWPRHRKTGRVVHGVRLDLGLQLWVDSYLPLIDKLNPLSNT